MAEASVTSSNEQFALLHNAHAFPVRPLSDDHPMWQSLGANERDFGVGLPPIASAGSLSKK